MYVLYLQYSDRTPQHSKLKSLRQCSTSHQQLTSVTKKSIPNVKGVLDKPLVIGHSRKRYGTLWNVMKQSQIGSGSRKTFWKGNKQTSRKSTTFSS